jgi:hypothetical protein
MFWFYVYSYNFSNKWLQFIIMILVIIIASCLVLVSHKTVAAPQCGRHSSVQTCSRQSDTETSFYPNTSVSTPVFHTLHLSSILHNLSKWQRFLTQTSVLGYNNRIMHLHLHNNYIRKHYLFSIVAIIFLMFMLIMFGVLLCKVLQFLPQTLNLV